MSDDIFIKHGLGSFQQPYNARQPSNAQQPNIRAQQEPNIRNVQEPNIRAQQEPNIRNYQVPTTYNHRSPTTYNHRSPLTYQHRSPADTQATYQSRQPSTYNHRSPFTYRHPTIYRHPGTYDHRSPYIADARQPTIKSAQEPNIRGAQEPNIRDSRQPNIRSAQEPNIVVGREPNIRAQQEPNIRSNQTPFTYARQGQTPSTYDHRSPFTYQARTPANGRVPYIYDGDTTSEPLLRSFWIHDTSNSGPSAADAQIRLKIKYSGNNIQIWGYYGGNPDEDATNLPNTGNPQVYALCYTVEPDYENAAADYTVRVTVANGDGEMTVTGGMSLNTAYSIPTDDSRIIQFSVESEITSGFMDVSRENCNLTIHLEKTGYTTWTYTPQLDIKATSAHPL